MNNVARLLLFGLLLAGSTAAADDLLDLKATFEQAVASLNARNLDGFITTVHPQALSFYSCYPTSGKAGKEACREDWTKFFSYSEKADFNAADFQYRIIGSTGIVWGNYSVAVKSRGVEKSYSGRFSLLYTKADGKWMIVWQENSPATPAAAKR